MALTLFSTTVVQRNYRAVYGVMFSHFTKCQNNFLLALGIITCVLMPLIGVFDSKHYPILHSCIAIAYFSFQMFYFSLFSFATYKA